MRRLVVGAAVLIGLASMTAADAQTEPTITLTDSSGTTAASIDLHIKADATSASRVYFLAAPGAAENVDVALDVEDASVTFTVDGATKTSTAVSPKKATLLRLTATKAGTGKLVLAVGNRPTTVPINVTQDTPAPFVVEGTNESGLALTAEADTLAADIVVRNTTAAPGDVAVQVSLQDPSGSYVPVTATTGGTTAADVAVPVAANGRLHVRLAAAIAAPGRYAGSIALLTGKAPNVVRSSSRLTVERVKATLPVTVEAAGRGRGTGWGTAGVAYDFTVKADGARPVVLDPPLFVRTTRAKGTDQDAAPLRGVTFENEAGEPVGITTLAPGQSQKWRLKVKDLKPGQYAGKVRVSAPGAAPIDTDVSLAVRRNGFLAGAVILVGIALSWFTTHFVRRLRNRLEVEDQLRGVTDYLNVAADGLDVDSDEQAALDSIGRQVDEVIEGASSKSRADLNAQVDALEAKVRLWRRWVMLRTEAEGPPVLNDVLSDLADMKDDLHAPKSSAADVKAADDKLAQYEKDIAAGRLHFARRDLVALQEAVKSAAQVAGPEDQERLKKLDPVLERVDKALTAGNLRPALLDLQSARADYAEVVLDHLRMLAARQPKIGDGDWAAWPAVARQVRDHVAVGKGTKDWETKVRAIEDAERALVLGVADRVSDTHPELADAAAEVKATAEANPRAARAKLHALLAQIPARPAPGESFVVEADAPTARLDALVMPKQHTATVERPAVPRRTLRSRSQIRALSAWLEFLVDLIAGIAALALGLQLLYIDNATWGSGGDIAIAFLWGLGVHQVANQATNGYAAVRTKVANEPAA